MGFKIAAASCENRWVNSFACYSMVALGCKAWFRMGDMPYINQDYSNNPMWGVEGAVSLDKDSTAAQIGVYYAQSLANAGTAYARTRMHTYHMMDDHEWMGEAWDHTIVQAETNNPIGVSGTALEQQDQVNYHHYQCILAFKAADNDNGNGIQFTNTAFVPDGALQNGASPDSSYYVANGFYVGYDFDGALNNTSPDVEFFVIDCITCRDPLADTDNSNKTMLGDYQKAAFKARLLATPATYKVIMSGKKLFKNSGGENLDGWPSDGTNPGYETERDEILDFIEANNITGVIWFSGDRHVHCVNTRYKSEGAGWDVVNVTSAVFNKDSVSGIADANTPFMRSSNSTPAAQHGYVVMDFDPSRALIQLRYSNRSASAAPMWEGQVLAGENKLSYPDIAVAA